MLDVEGPQGHDDTSTPNQIDEPMHDAHAEVGLGQSLDFEPLQSKLLTSSKKSGCERWVKEPVEHSTPSRLDRVEVIY